jgi:hypothetical protein
MPRDLEGFAFMHFLRWDIKRTRVGPLENQRTGWFILLGAVLGSIVLMHGKLDYSGLSVSSSMSAKGWRLRCRVVNIGPFSVAKKPA